jgi:hypothetical protein
VEASTCKLCPGGTTTARVASISPTDCIAITVSDDGNIWVDNGFIAAQSLLGTSIIAVIGILLYRRHVNNSWMEAPQHALADLVRRRLRLSLGLRTDAEMSGYINSPNGISEITGRVLRVQRSHDESDGDYYLRVGAVIQSMNEGQLELYAEAICDAIREHISFEEGLCCCASRAPQSFKHKPMLYRKRYLHNCFFIPCLRSYQFSPEVFRRSMRDVVATVLQGSLPPIMFHRSSVVNAVWDEQQIAVHSSVELADVTKGESQIAMLAAVADQQGPSDDVV